MDKLYDVDENAPWRNDPLAKRAVLAAREWNVHHRKGKEAIKPQQNAVIDYGMILLEVRKQHTSNNKYKEEVLTRRLDIPPFNERRERSAALAIAEIVDDRVKFVDDLVVNDLFEGCDATNAQMMVRWARKTGLILPKKRNPAATPMAREQIRVAAENGQAVNRDAISQATGLSDGAVGRAHAMERARLEGVIEGEAIALNAQGKLTKAQAKHIEALLKKFRRELDSQFKSAVEAQVDKRVKERKAALERAQEACAKQRNDAFKDQQHWKKLINNHKPLLTEAEDNAILKCIHPNGFKQITEDRMKDAFIVYERIRTQLTGKRT